MINLIRKIIYYLPISFLLRNIILLESNPDMADNTYYVYKELLKQKLNEKYKLVWVVDDKNNFKKIHEKNVFFISKKNEKVKYNFLHLFSRYIIDCNKYVPKLNKNQVRVYLGHGMPIKVVPQYTSEVGKCDYFILTSDYFIDYFKMYVKDEECNFVSVGYPRTDIFFTEKEYFANLDSYKKIIVWMPTYRKNINNGLGYENNYKYGVPSINDESQLKKLNEILGNYSSYLIIKLHPVEDDTLLKKFNYSNILFTKNELLSKNNKRVYDLLNISDALITDYSSIYYDYLLKDKPIGMAVEDVEEYKKSFDVFFDDFETNLPGEYIYSYDDLVRFIINVCENRDLKKDERNQKKQLYEKFDDGNASLRIVELLRNEGL